MSLQVTITGHGPDLVLLHGWGIPSGVWQATAATLGSRFRVHCVDLPGYAGSAALGPYTAAQVVAQLSAALPSAIACGWSLGGQLALQWALQAPQQVQRLILVATTPCFSRRADWRHGVDAALLTQAAQAVTADASAFLTQFAALIANGDTAERSLVRQMRDILAATPLTSPEALLAGLGWLAETDLRAQLSSLPMPALVIHGKQDAIAPPAAAAALAAALPHARLQLMHGVGHAPFLSRPHEFAAQVLAFCDE